MPTGKVAGIDLGATMALDMVATIVVAHSKKAQASPTFKKTFGFHPLGVVRQHAGVPHCEAADRFDHNAVLTPSISQIPATHRRELLIRA